LTQELPSGKDKAMQTEMFEVDPLSDNRKLYVRAAEALAAGALVGIPTETVYGLGADALNPEAVARVFEAKGRPSFDPLIIHVHHGKEVDKYTAIPEELKELVHTLASKFWPGPLTMVLPKADIIPDIVTSLPPSLLITSDNDNLQSYTLNFEKALRRHQMPHKLINYPKDPRLTHAFSAFYPDLPESREVIHHLIHFFEHTGDDCKGGYVS
jgi:hypothetical protein